MQQFEATIESGTGGGAYVAVPGEVVAALGGGGGFRLRRPSTVSSIAGPSRTWAPGPASAC
ncbi:hypothetical protein ACIBCN_18065 [Nocardia sp. NPDC051052]|uniref:hypothetical protein n=1 Tax=Nocardia sp. NPDC051052 TaxID=3364322 RepID=UPI0037A72238